MGVGVAVLSGCCNSPARLTSALLGLLAELPVDTTLPRLANGCSPAPVAARGCGGRVEDGGGQDGAEWGVAGGQPYTSSPIIELPDVQ